MSHDKSKNNKRRRDDRDEDGGDSKGSGSGTVSRKPRGKKEAAGDVAGSSELATRRSSRLAGSSKTKSIADVKPLGPVIHLLLKVCLKVSYI